MGLTGFNKRRREKEQKEKKEMPEVSPEAPVETQEEVSSEEAPVDNKKGKKKKK
jgi:hypothetical protein